MLKHAIRRVRLEQTLKCYQTLGQKVPGWGCTSPACEDSEASPQSAKQKENLDVSGVGVKHVLYI